MRIQAAAIAVLESFTEWIRGLGKTPAIYPTLLALTPNYSPKHHGVYVGVIEAALNNANVQVRNIALTGSYGVGKSSILEEVTRLHRGKVISVSLSSLGFSDEDPPQTGAAARNAGTKTNRIQKEIVKQLLYNEDPVRMPGSRYRRISRFRFWRETALAIVVAIPLTVAFFLCGWTTQLTAVFPVPAELSLLPNAIVFAGLTLLVLALRAMLHNRIQISQLSAGAATIALSPKSTTYFDEYLDEIVYFFETVNSDIVIFEDIDRFDDAHIFETLRSLNALLNGADQLRGRRIRFIYAIKDSIFDELGRLAVKEVKAGTSERDDGVSTTHGKSENDAAQAEIARANRTKFFDLVVPVVPFITHRSARDLLTLTLKDLNHSVSPRLVDLASRHVADMRLLKNIRNEFAIFKRQVIDEGTLDLEENGVFAMVLYKNTHLSDFELVRLGNSNLDSLYQFGRKIVNENIAALNRRIATDRRSLLTVRTVTRRGVELGAALERHITMAMTHFSGTNIRYEYAGESIADEELQTDAFWEKLVDGDGAVIVRYHHRNMGSSAFEVSRTDLSTVVGDSLKGEDWKRAERERLFEAISDAAKRRAFLASADMAALMSRPEFTGTLNSIDVTFDAAAKKYLKSELAQELVQAGFINRNYTLYTSTFYAERVTVNAMNFIIKNVDPHVIDSSFELEDKDIQAVLRERKEILSTKAAFNNSIVDYILTNDTPGVRTVVDQLVRYGDEEKDFLLGYLETGKQKGPLVQLLATQWSKIFSFLLTDAALPEEEQRRIVDIALKAARDDVEYVVDTATKDYLVSSYSTLDVFTSDTTSEKIAATLAALMDRAGIVIPSLAPLGTNPLRLTVQRGLYLVTRKNLETALGDDHYDLALDAIAGASEAVYRRVLNDLPGYLHALDGRTTITSSTHFITQIEAVLKVDPDSVATVIEQANQSCRINLLRDVSVETWPALAQFERFPLTFENVQAYVSDMGLDERLAALLLAEGEIAVEEHHEESEKLTLALALLNAEEVLPSPKLRARLIKSLELVDPIAPSSVPKEKGELIGWLISNNNVSDNASAFTALATDDVDGRAFAVSKSNNFLSFMTPTELPPQQLGQLVSHPLVPAEVKSAVVDRFAEFTADASAHSQIELAQYGSGIGSTLPLSEVSILSGIGLEAPIVLSFLRPHLSDLGLDEITPILESLGSNYLKLTTKNGKHPQIAYSESADALLARLKILGVVNSFTHEKDVLVVHMKKPV